jgi:hypothetical protein
MIDKINPIVPIELGGKTRHLKFDFNAMVAYEEATGKNFLEMSKITVSAKNLRAWLYACLVQEDRSLTIDEVGGWIDLENMAGIADKLTEALQAAMPEKGDKKEAAPLVEKPPAG